MNLNCETRLLICTVYNPYKRQYVPRDNVLSNA